MINKIHSPNFRSISASEITSIFGYKDLKVSISAAYLRLQRRTWRFKGQKYFLGGLDWEKDKVLLYRTENESVGCAKYLSFAISISDALDCISGNIQECFLR